MNDRSGVLVSTARSVHAGRTVALADADVVDGGGHRVAIASTRCVILPRLELPEGFDREPMPDLVEPLWDTPHPYLRQPVGEVQPQEVFDSLSGLEVLRGCVTGRLPPPPLAHLTGLRPVAAETGSSEWMMPASEWLCSPVPGRLYGGAIGLIAGIAVEGSIETTVPAGTVFATVDMKVYFLRPVLPDGGELRARGTVVHRGRTVAIATSEVLDAEGRKVALATGSGLILPGRPAALATPTPDPD